MQPVIHVHNLKKYFSVPLKAEGFSASLKSLFYRKHKIVKAVDDVSFDIHEAEMVAFLGPNGAGKTTTLKILSGILYQTGGTVSVLGHKPWKRKPEFQKQLSLVMGQKNQLWWDLPPTDSFLLNRDIYAVPHEEYKRTLNELVELLEVSDILTTQVRKLSLGQRMKCELIAALLHKPKVLFLDEPTIGLDIAMQKKIRAFFKDYNKRYRTTIMLTSHYMDDVKEICDRVIMIDRGHKIYDGKIQDLIATYAKDKYLYVDFEKKIQQDKIAHIGEVLEFNGWKAVIAVPRSEHAKKAALLLSTLPVENLDIAEEQLEDIILKYFTKRI